MKKILKNSNSKNAETGECLIVINQIFHESMCSLNLYYEINWNDNILAGKDIPNYFKFLSYITYKNFIIELTKIINDSDNEKFNLFSFLERLSNNQIYFLNENKLKKYIELLSSFKDKEFAEIILSRHKYYAHTDVDHLNYKNFFANRETQGPINVIKEILDYLNSSLKINPDLTYKKMPYPDTGSMCDTIYINLFK